MFIVSSPRAMVAVYYGKALGFRFYYHSDSIQELPIAMFVINQGRSLGLPPVC